MTQPHINKLESFVRLSDKERAALTKLSDNVVGRSAGSDLVREGERPQNIHILLEGWACRYKLLPDGGRQIMAYLVPGDLCDVHVFILKRMDHNIGLLSDARIGLVSEQTMIDLMDQNPRIARAMYWAALVDEATSRAWLANSLRRDPFERLAHLFCELWVRLNSIGLVLENTFDLPLTQAELGDTIGLNSVTINRILQRLRTEKLISLGNRRLTILDVQRLMSISGFDANYLHLDRAKADR